MQKSTWKIIAIISMIFNVLYLCVEYSEKLPQEEQEAIRVREKSAFYAFGLKGLAEAYLAKEDFKRALELFEESYLHNPSDAGLLLNMGYTHKRLGELKMAEHYYLAAIASGNNNTVYKACNNLANTYREQGRIDLAEDVYREAIKLKPQNWLALYNYAVMLQESGSKAKGDSILFELEKATVPQPIVLMRLRLGFLEAGMPDSANIRLERAKRIQGIK